MQAPIRQDREAYVVQQAYRAGQAQQPFLNKQGRARVDIEPDGAYVEAGEGPDRAQVFIPARREYVTVNQRRPIFKRKATWLIIVLVLLIIGGIVAGVAVHEANKDNSGY